jgi:hypothetical protein
MDLSVAELEVLNRFRIKARMAGGAQPGFLLRKDSIFYGREEASAEGLTGLVEKDVLVANEAGSIYFLTAKGVEMLAELP